MSPLLPVSSLPPYSPACLKSVREEVKALEKMVSGGSSFLHFPHPSSSLSRASSGEEQSGVHADVE